MTVESYTDVLREFDGRMLLKAVLTMFGAVGIALSATFLYSAFFLVVYEVLADAGVFEGGGSFELIALMRLAFEVPVFAVLGVLLGKLADSVTMRQCAFYAVGVYTLTWGVWVHLVSIGVLSA